MKARPGGWCAESRDREDRRGESGQSTGPTSAINTDQLQLERTATSYQSRSRGLDRQEGEYDIKEEEGRNFLKISHGAEQISEENVEK